MIIKTSKVFFFKLLNLVKPFGTSVLLSIIPDIHVHEKYFLNSKKYLSKIWTYYLSNNWGLKIEAFIKKTPFFLKI